MCDICPRKCKIDRSKGEKGFCGVGSEILLSSICVHWGEEPILSGSKGALCVFLGSCNLKCVYCQNWQISQPTNFSIIKKVTTDELTERVFLEWQKHKTHNIEWVSPSHFVPQIREATINLKKKGITAPFVYNTNAYDSVESLKSLENIIDIYLPDLKYFDKEDQAGVIYSSAPAYVKHAKEAIVEMYRQVGALKLDNDGIAKKGLLIRLLVLPYDLSNTREALSWLKERFGSDISISIMSQYMPCHKAKNFPKLSRPINYYEYDIVLSHAKKLNFENIFIQPYEEKSWNYYWPDFEKETPFDW